MIPIEPILVCDLPVSRQDAGFPVEGDHGNALLLIAHEMRPQAQAAYQEAGCIHEGVCLSSCAEALFPVLEAMCIRWCPWPDRTIILAVLPHNQMGVLADRLVVSRLLAAEHGAGNEGRKEEP